MWNPCCQMILDLRSKTKCVLVTYFGMLAMKCTKRTGTLWFHAMLFPVLEGVTTNLLIFSCFSRQYQYAVSILETGRTAVLHIAFYQLLYLEIFSFPFSTPTPCAASIHLNTNFTHTLSFRKTCNSQVSQTLISWWEVFFLFSHLLLFSLFKSWSVSSLLLPQLVGFL